MLPLRHQLLIAGCLLVVVGGMLATQGQWTVGGTIGMWGLVMGIAGMLEGLEAGWAKPCDVRANPRQTANRGQNLVTFIPPPVSQQTRQRRCRRS